VADDRVVFVSHEATRTGAPIGLLQTLRWLVDHTDLDLQLIVLKAGADGGQLLDEFAAVVPTTVSPEFADPGPRWHRLPSADVVFLNSIFSGGVLDHLRGRPEPFVITRVPELSMSFQHGVSDEVRDLILGKTDRFVAVSERVAAMLTDEFSVPTDRITLIRGCVDLTGADAATDEEVAALGDRLGIPDDAFVLGGAGTTDWRKGPDLFVQLARAIEAVYSRRPVHYLWVGGAEEGPAFWRIERDLADRDLVERVHFVGSVPDPFPYYRLMDVYALTSREDPFPRVCLEVAGCGVPIVTFDNGGAPEFVRQGAGEVVGYLDVDTMTERVTALFDDPAARAAHGRTGAEIVRRDHTIEVGARAVLAEIEHGLGRR
jgi:glycosyltransferase involved in cell wall biosynthesis